MNLQVRKYAPTATARPPAKPHVHRCDCACHGLSWICATPDCRRPELYPCPDCAGTVAKSGRA